MQHLFFKLVRFEFEKAYALAKFKKIKKNCFDAIFFYLLFFTITSEEVKTWDSVAVYADYIIFI